MNSVLMNAKSRLLRIGLSACFFYPDPQRKVFITKTLLYFEESLAHWLMAHNIMPILLPRATAEFSVTDILNQVDALVLQGGSDMAPSSYGQQAMQEEWNGDRERDVYEIALVRAALALNKPVFGICRGLQVINVAFGGTLHQDIATQIDTKQEHRNPKLYDKLTHEVQLEKNGYLAQLYANKTKSARCKVISIHHQAIAQLGANLHVEARSSSDGIIEAIRYVAPSVDTDKASISSEPAALASVKMPYIFGVQWHPEFQAANDASLLDPRPMLNDFLAAVHARISTFV